MNNFEIDGMEIQEIRRKILNSDSNIKKKLLNEDMLKEISYNLKNMSTEEIKKIINSKIELIKEKDIQVEELEKVECEIAVLIKSLPQDKEKIFEYWKEVEENAKK